jgi:HEAT repeats
MTLLPLACALAVFASLPKTKLRPIGNAKEDSESALPLQSNPKPQASADVAFDAALAQVFEPAPIEIRVRAVENVGLLGDVRGLNPLAHLALDPNPLLAQAAVRAVGLMQHPRAEEILTDLIFHPVPNEATKQLALRMLAFQNTNSARMTIGRLAAGRSGNTPLVVAARSVYNTMR